MNTGLAFFFAISAIIVVSGNEVPAKTCFYPDHMNSKAPWHLTFDIAAHVSPSLQGQAKRGSDSYTQDPAVCLKSKPITFIAKNKTVTLSTWTEIFNTFKSAKNIVGPDGVHIVLEESTSSIPCWRVPTRLCIHPTSGASSITLNLSQVYVNRNNCISMPFTNTCFSNKPLEFLNLVDKFWNISPITLTAF